MGLAAGRRHSEYAVHCSISHPPWLEMQAAMPATSAEGAFEAATQDLSHEFAMLFSCHHPA
jgi:hypothetical protein